jgi:hypothetical protein
MGDPDAEEGQRELIAKAERALTYEKAVSALVRAGFLDVADADVAVAALSASTVEFTHPAWTDALAQAGLIDGTNVEAAVSAMEKAALAEAGEDPEGFDEGLENAGILWEVNLCLEYCRLRAT